MPIYFAPLEGVTDAIFRRVHRACFSGVDKYFIPFVSPTQNLFFTPKDLSAIAPEHNDTYFAVPQLMAKDAALFLWAAHELQGMGYPEINLNLGCPSGTVTAKGKGSGLLRTPDALRALLDEIFAHTPIPVSVKTRIGFASPDEWPALMDILADYPIHELIVHPRTRVEFYKGRPHREAYEEALHRFRCPVVYNGDLFSLADCERLLADCPATSALMLGRGLISHPALAREMKGGEGLTLAALVDFHDRLLEAYVIRGPDSFALTRMRYVMMNMGMCFVNPDRALRNILKEKTVAGYSAAVRRLFEEHEMRNPPRFGEAYE